MPANGKWTAVVLLAVGMTTAGAGVPGLAQQEPKVEAQQQPATTVVEPPRPVAADSESSIREEIASLLNYYSELSVMVDRREREWLKLAEGSNVAGSKPPQSQGDGTDAMPVRVSIDEYNRVREQLFATNMDLIEAEARLKNQQAEQEARVAGMDPEALIQKRTEEQLRNDPQLKSLRSQLESARQRMDQAARLARDPADPTRRAARQRVLSLEVQYRELWDQKHAQVSVRLRDQGRIEDGKSLAELKSQIESTKIRKTNYEQLLAKLEATRQRQGTAAVTLALIREDLFSLKKMKETVAKRIEQLVFDASASRRKH
jgi:hypothetical protein